MSWRESRIYGQAYLSAFLDSEVGKPKIQPGQCRIIKENLPNAIINIFEDNCCLDDVFGFIRGVGTNHYHYYWMVNDTGNIGCFDKQYRDTYSSKYTGMLKALRRYF